MEIYQVESSLVCTQRSTGLHHAALRVLRNADGVRMVATDPVGARQGNHVFTVSGSAARYAMGDFSIHTDLTIGGIIDHWEDTQPTTQSPQMSVRQDAAREQTAIANTGEDNGD